MVNRKRKISFWYRNSLSVALLLLAVFSLAGQVLTGWHEFNSYLRDKKAATVSFADYLHSGHFIQSTFENWESEFFQMGLFVILTIFLRQWGSSESKGFTGKEDVDRAPKAHANAPYPVRKGGILLSIYKNSLSISFILLFLFSFIMHWYGSCKDYNLQQLLKGEPRVEMFEYLGHNRFWFESFQNWQSEFLSVFALIVFSIYLRQKGSPQSKPVDAPHEQTGE